MKESETTHLEGQLVDEDVEFTLVELCRVTGASEDELTLWVSEGVFDPDGTDRRTGASVARRCAVSGPRSGWRTTSRSTRRASPSYSTCWTKSTRCGRTPGVRREDRSMRSRISAAATSPRRQMI